MSATMTPEGPLQAGSPIPDFEGVGMDGATYVSHVLREQGLVLAVLFKTGCGTCKYALPYLQRLHTQYAEPSGGRFVVLGISQNGAEETRTFARDYGNATFPILLDSDLSMSAQYGITHVPDLYLLGSGERIQDAVVGHFSTEGFNRIAQEAADYLQVPYVPVVREEDNAPVLKPG